MHSGELRRDVRLSFAVNASGAATARRLRADAEAIVDFGPLLRNTRVDIALHWNARAARVQVDSLCLSAMSDSDLFIKLDRHGPNQLTMESSRSARRIQSRPLSLSALRLYPISMGIESRNTKRSRELEQGVFRFTPEEYALFLFMQQLATAAASVFHIGPLREMPSRAYRVDQMSAAGSAGSVVEVLDRQRQAQKRVSEAMSRMGMARDVSLLPLAPGYVGIALTDPLTGRVDNLADVGFGVSQVLPILVSLATARPHSTVLIEQPELHLHPDAQGQLADVMVEFSRETQSSLVMETHSEHIMLRLQRRVAEGSLAPEDVAIYVVDGGIVRGIALDSVGRLDAAAMPEGFFEEEWEDALKLARAAAERSLA